MTNESNLIDQIAAHPTVVSGDWFSNPQIANLLKAHYETCRYALHELVRLGKIESNGKPTSQRRYRVAVPPVKKPKAVKHINGKDRSAKPPTTVKPPAAAKASEPVAKVRPKPAPTFRAEVGAALNEIGETLVAMNAAYGDSALNPVRVFSQLGPVDGLRVRIDDKLSRLARGEQAGEDVEADLLGYLILLRIARKRGDATP